MFLRELTVVHLYLKLVVGACQLFGTLLHPQFQLFVQLAQTFNRVSTLRHVFNDPDCAAG